MRAMRLLLMVIVLGCTVSLAGCGMLDSTDTSADPTSTETIEETATESTTTDQSETTDSTERTAEKTSEKDQSDQQDDTNGDSVPVVGGELGVDQDRVFAQLNSLLGTDVDTPERIVVSDTTFTGGSVALDTDPFRLLIDEEIRSLPGYSGTYSGGEITMVTADRASTDIEATLAHEYVHHVQAVKDLEIPDRSGSSYYEAGLIENALDEGGAVYVTNKYIMEYMDWQQLKADQIAFVEANYDAQFSINGSGIQSQIEYTEAGYKQANAAERYFAAPYYYGSQYLSERNLSLNEYFELYENPPTTTEQLIHSYKPGEEEPVTLELNTTEVSGENVLTGGRLGELTLRLTLFSELNETRAWTAAEGWGNDVIANVVTQEGDTNLVWTVRMDTEQDAEELRTAMAAYIDGRATKQDAIWFDQDDSLYLSVDSPDSKTVVLSLGTESFVRSLTVSSNGDGDTVRLASGD